MAGIMGSNQRTIAIAPLAIAIVLCYISINFKSIEDAKHNLNKIVDDVIERLDRLQLIKEKEIEKLFDKIQDHPQ